MQRVPRRTWLTLTCDGAHGLLSGVKRTFYGPNFVVQYSAAMAAGWKDTASGEDRVFLCPYCSKKRVAQ
jgi:hypothetical protein